MRYYYLSKNILFERAMFICILLNTAVLASDHYNSSDQFKLFDKITNYIFVIIFTAEVIIKIIGFGKRYFMEGWQVFDFVIVILSIVGIILEESLQENKVGLSALMKGLRSIRILKLFKRNKSLRVIFDTFMITLPNLLNVGSLLLLLFYIYAILGINLFAIVK